MLCENVLDQRDPNEQENTEKSGESDDIFAGVDEVLEDEQLPF
ncbi:hypothetical protein [Bacillus sp. AFS098217]|nr:hypothetical protein [Bacillus sp. AFS098217]